MNFIYSVIFPNQLGIRALKELLADVRWKPFLLVDVLFVCLVLLSVGQHYILFIYLKLMYMGFWGFGASPPRRCQRSRGA